MVIAVIAAGPIMDVVQYVYTLLSTIGSFVLGALGLFLPY